MVHALEQAWRVLSPGGRLVDIHPAITHARIGYVRDSTFIPTGCSRFPLIHYRQASRAVQQVQASGLFSSIGSQTFQCMTYGSASELADWIVESDEPEAVMASKQLVQRAYDALRADPGAARVGVRERIIIRVLRKTGTESGNR